MGGERKEYCTPLHFSTISGIPCKGLDSDIHIGILKINFKTSNTVLIFKKKIDIKIVMKANNIYLTKDKSIN